MSLIGKLLTSGNALSTSLVESKANTAGGSRDVAEWPKAGAGQWIVRFQPWPAPRLSAVVAINVP